MIDFDLESHQTEHTCCAFLLRLGVNLEGSTQGLCRNPCILDQSSPSDDSERTMINCAARMLISNQ